MPCSVGNILKGFGGFDWVVLDVANGKALILTKDIVRADKPHSNRLPMIWTFCYLRNYLNRQFYKSLSKNKNEHECIQKEWMDNHRNSQHLTFGGPKSKDRVSLLSFEEVESYFPYEENRVANYKKRFDQPEAPHAWWLRSPGDSYKTVAVVDATGEIKHDTKAAKEDNCPGVRPVLWVKLESLGKHGYKFIEPAVEPTPPSGSN